MTYSRRIKPCGNDPGQEANVVPGRTGNRINEDLSRAADCDRISCLEAPVVRIQVIDASVGEKIACRQVRGPRDDCKYVGVKINGSDDMLAWAWVKKNVVAYHHCSRRYRACTHVYCQWSCQQDVLILIEPEQVGTLKVVVTNTVGRTK